MKPFRVFTSRTVVLPAENVDTDQIIPARFLRVTTRDGLGRHLFADWRYDRDGQPRPEFILNRPEAEGARILVAGDNFGCGSSREHAPWALVDHGFEAVVSTSIADIFANNAVKNGLLPVVVDPNTHHFLVDHPGLELTIDLEQRSLSWAGGRTTFPIDAFARYCLLHGMDPLDFLLSRQETISSFETSHDQQTF